MKKQIQLPAILIFLAGVIFIFPNWRSNNFTINKRIEIETNCKFAFDSIERIEDDIACNISFYSKYPTLDSIRNTFFAELLKSLNRPKISETYTKILNRQFNPDIYNYLSNESKGKLKSYGYIDFQTRIDGEKLAWAPVALLPTNGKFIMMIVANWEKDAYEPPSSGFFLCTFKLTGEMQSMVYAYGREEINRNKQNKDTLNGILGKAYCLNTDKIVVRKAIIWDRYSNRDGFRGCTLEIKELNYIISEDGIIQSKEELLIFPKKEVKWIDRQGISFSEESDTVKKMLGEIK
jgi:hypothetical protein